MWWLRFVSSLFLIGIGAISAMPHALQAPGGLRVIVQFRLDADLCATAPGTEQCQQSIARGREALLQELGGTSYQVTRVYDTIPFVALEVSPEALRLLEGSKRVVGITPDTLHAPQSMPSPE